MINIPEKFYKFFGFPRKEDFDIDYYIKPEQSIDYITLNAIATKTDSYFYDIIFGGGMGADF